MFWRLKRIITDSWFQPPWNDVSLWEDAGLEFCNSMKDGRRKFLIVHFEDNRALLGSWLENRRTRSEQYMERMVRRVVSTSFVMTKLLDLI